MSATCTPHVHRRARSFKLVRSRKAHTLQAPGRGLVHNTCVGLEAVEPLRSQATSCPHKRAVAPDVPAVDAVHRDVLRDVKAWRHGAVSKTAGAILLEQSPVAESLGTPERETLALEKTLH